MQILLNILIAYGVICMIFTTFFLINLVRNIRREVNVIEGVKEAAETLKIVYIEYDVVDSMYRMYDKFTNQYVCQSKDEIELWKIARSMFPTKKVMLLDKDKGL